MSKNRGQAPPDLPDHVGVDFADRTVELRGYRPVSGDLVAYLRLDGLLEELVEIEGEITSVQAKARLHGLPASWDVKLGPFTFASTEQGNNGNGGSGDEKEEGKKVTTVDVRIESNQPIGGFEVDADARTTTRFGDVLGRVTASGVPRTVDIESQFGDPTELHLLNSGRLDSLEVQATANAGTRPSALATLADVPPEVDFKVKGFSKDTDADNKKDEDGDSKTVVPKIKYNGHDVSTLDGSVQIEGKLFEVWSHEDDAMLRLGDVWASFTNLGHTTKLRVKSEEKEPSTAPACIRAIGGGDSGNGPEMKKVVSLDSTPKTDAFEFGASIDTSVPRIDIECDADDPLFEQDDIPTPGLADLGFRGRLEGHLALPTVAIDDLAVELTDVEELRIAESPATSWATPGVEGEYGSLRMDLGEVGIESDVSVDFALDMGVGGPGPIPTVYAPVPIAFAAIRADRFSDQVRLRLAEQVEHPSECVAVWTPSPVVMDLNLRIHVVPTALPGPIATGVNQISIPSGGRYTLNLLPTDIDVTAVAPGAWAHSSDWGLLLVDLLTGKATAPFREPEKKLGWTVGLGPCV